MEMPVNVYFDQLPADTQEILDGFLKNKREAAADKDPFAEDWGLSQFWYTKETALKVAAEAARAAKGGRIACLACPSLFRALQEEHPDAAATVFEFDRRFEVLGNYCFYDFNYPESVPADLLHAFAVVVADPPYLAAECLQKTCETMRLLAASPSTIHYLLTGSTMRGTAYQELKLRPVNFRPEHQNKLGNEFLLYCSPEADARPFGSWDTELDPSQQQHKAP